MTEAKSRITGIGSLPYADVEQALDLIFKHTPYIPFWPQLPKRDRREGMIAQFSEGLPCNENKLEDFYARIIACDIDYFKISKDYALGLYGFVERLKKVDISKIRYIKGHITGPFTFASGINDENGNTILFNPILMQAVIKGLLMKALWQIKFLSSFSKKPIIFIDEPYLGCFGSAYTPVNREDVIKGLQEFTAGIKKSQDVLIGVHCCGNTDWSILTDISTVDIISFDAFGFQERFTLYADNLKAFLERGGYICWGIVPTQDFSSSPTAEDLAARLEKGIEALVKKGIDKGLLFKNLLASPSCGLGNLDIGCPERIFSRLGEAVEKLFDKGK